MADIKIYTFTNVAYYVDDDHYKVYKIIYFRLLIEITVITQWKKFEQESIILRIISYNTGPIGMHAYMNEKSI